ncbi:MAG: sodium:calcium antiporter, partial [Acidimicrobiales bacterium]
TSLPEMVVSSIAAAQRDTIDLAASNIVGSNLANLTLALGAAALITHVTAPREIFVREGGLMLAAAALFGGFALTGRLEQWHGIALLIVMIGAAIMIALNGPAETTSKIVHIDRRKISQAFITALIALIGVVIGAQLLVSGAVDIAKELGVSEALTGLTIVSIGTSLPEIATAVAAARRGSVELIIGNVFGSNIFNALAVGGVAGILGTGEIVETTNTSLWIMIGVSAIVLTVGLVGRGYSRSTGIALLLAYPVILIFAT